MKTIEDQAQSVAEKLVGFYEVKKRDYPVLLNVLEIALRERERMVWEEVDILFADSLRHYQDDSDSGRRTALEIMRRKCRQRAEETR